MQCEECGCRLDPRLGRPRHSNPRCDPGPAWWELPEWAEWLRAAEKPADPIPAVVTPERRESG